MQIYVNLEQGWMQYCNSNEMFQKIKVKFSNEDLYFAVCLSGNEKL